jgi:hypothetical protein
VLSLKWEGIDWTKNRITVLSPKTEHHPNGAQRVIPLFPELVEPLKEVERTKPTGAMHVISRHRSRADVSDSWADSNLREPMLDILKRANIKPWPKLFQAMRASCETDLVRGGYQLKDVTAWMGHSHKVAEKHYLHTLEDEFDRAVKFGAKNGAKNAGETAPESNCPTQNSDASDFSSSKKTVRKAVLQTPAGDCTEKPRNAKSPQNTGSCKSLQLGATCTIGQVGLYAISVSPCKDGSLGHSKKTCAAKSAALSNKPVLPYDDQQALERIFTHWTALSPEAKSDIQRIVEAEIQINQTPRRDVCAPLSLSAGQPIEALH